MKLWGKLKVTVSLTHGLHPMWVTEEGLKFNDAFTNRLYEKEEFFRERIILQINDIAGDGWAVHFGECPDLMPTYLVDITAEDRHLRAIIQVISDAFPEVSFDFWRPTRPYTPLGKRPAIAK